MDILMIIILVIVVILIIGIILIYNGLVNARNKVKNSWAQIEVQLNRRADLIPNLVETVKGYASHEKEVFEKVTSARSGLLHAQGVEEVAEANNMLTDTLRTLFAVSENYPDLKANENFINLQNQLKDTEDKIAYARQFYNDTVLMYNNKCETFPSNIFANIFNFKETDFFKGAPGSEQVPKVEF
ncbi:LemA family protein [uncultured Methanobrevibacter sp.]|uniref:LemA family protein n=1 Tax=uncultured Methanobrevibacter sp. TaxID=253161 RepID=UPI00258F625F|nr:LemA family protein [uncultured Methanobrevibacter sp.]